MATFYGTGIGGNYPGRMTIKTVATIVSQNIAANTSIINLKVYAYYNYDKYNTVNPTTGFQYIRIDEPTGSTNYAYSGSENFDYAGTSSTNTVKIMDWTSGPITHNSDGTKTINVDVYQDCPGVTTLDYMYDSFDWTLDTIPRASVPTLSASSAALGNSVTITTNRVSTAFTHTIKYKLGTTTTETQVATGVTTSYSWSLPASLASALPSTTSGTMTIYVYTYSGTTLIGTKTVSMTVTIPNNSTYAPTVSFSAVEATAAMVGSGFWLAGKSNIKITPSSSFKYGATLKSYSISVGGVALSGNPAYSGVIATTGTKSISVTVTDSRGFQSTSSSNVTFISLPAPTRSASSVEFGSKVTITTNRPSTAVTSTLFYKVGSIADTQFASSVGASFLWTIPSAAIGGLSNVTSGTITVTQKFYNGTNYLGSTSVTLTGTIPKSVPSVNVTSATPGTTLTVSTARKHTTLTHTLKYSFGTTSNATLSTNVGDSYTWLSTDNDILANALTTATSGTLTFTLYTYNGTALIGSNTKTITINIPSTSAYRPSASVTISEGTSTMVGAGAYISGHSSLKVISSGSGKAGATISSYTVSVNGSIYIGSTITSSVIASSGSIPVKVTVKDSRGYSGEYQTFVSFVAVSAPTFNLTTVDLGDEIIVTTNRASTAITHTLKYTYGTKTGTIATSVGASHSWTLANEMAVGIPSAKSGVVTVTQESYFGAKLLDTKSSTFTATIPKSVDFEPVPAIASIAEGAAGLSAFTVFIQGKSKLVVTSSASFKHGATLLRYDITINGVTYAGSPAVSSIINSSGSIPIKVKVTDSRGYTGEITGSANVVAYAPPKLTLFKAIRDQEVNLSTPINFEISTISNQNTKSYVIEYRPTGGTWITAHSSSTVYTLNTTLNKPSVLSNSLSYEVRLTISDYFVNVVQTASIGTGFSLLDFRNTGKGLAFGKVSEKDGLEFGMPIYGGIQGEIDNVKTLENWGALYTSSSTNTGVIIIDVGTDNVMFNAKISLRSYNFLADIHVGGYTNAATSSWHNPQATGDSYGDNLNVRFASNGSNRYILIGEVSTNWGGYLHVTIDKVAYGYGGYAAPAPYDISLGSAYPGTVNATVGVGDDGISQITIPMDNVTGLAGALAGKSDSGHTHTIATVEGLQTALNGKVDDSQVLTNVPAGAKFTDTVYTHPTTSGNKHIPSGGASGQFLKWSADGTAVWAADNNTVYTHPTTSGNKHIPSGGAAGQFLKWSADGTAVWAADNNTVYTHPTTSGNKHIPSGGAAGQFLKWSADGTAVWAYDNNTVYTHPSTHPASIITQDASNRFVTDTEKATWNNKGEAFLTWGGKNFSGTYGCIDAAMIDNLGANRLAFVDPVGVDVEYSRDGGLTWLDYGASNSQKISLFSGLNGNLIIGKADAANKATAAYQLRVTIKTGLAKVYTVLNKFCLYVSTNGSSGCTCTIDAALEASPTAFTTMASSIPISGWSGYNIINTSGITTYGNSSTTQYGRLRFTFRSTGGSTTYTGLQVLSIYGYGGVGWTAPSNLAKSNHLYAWDSAQNALFPANIHASGFVGNSTTSTKLATARTISLTGDVTGSVSFDGSTNASITATVVDDSHNHTIANVDGLQTALNGKVDDSQVLTNVPAGAKFTDTVYTHPTNHPASIITQDASNRFVTDTEKATWNAKGTSNLALGTTSTTAYRGDYGNTAYTHSQATHAPTNARANQVLTSGNGMAAWTATSGNLTISLGTPSAITKTSTNSVTTTSHTHAISLSASDLGAIPKHTLEDQPISGGSGWYKVAELAYSSAPATARFEFKIYNPSVSPHLLGVEVSVNPGSAVITQMYSHRPGVGVMGSYALGTIGVKDSAAGSAFSLELNLLVNGTPSSSSTISTTIIPISGSWQLVAPSKDSNYSSPFPTLNISTSSGVDSNLGVGGLGPVSITSNPTSGQVLKWNGNAWAPGTDNNTTYTHPTTSGNKHIPSGGAAGQFLKWSADGTAVWAADNNTVYTHPTSAGNKHIPVGGAAGQFLKYSSEGTAVWAADNNTTYSAGNGLSLSSTTFSLGTPGTLTGATTNATTSTSHTHSITTSSTGASNTIMQTNSSGDAQARLFKSTYANQSTISGAMAFRTNNSSDTYIRFCSDAAAIRTFLSAGSLDGSIIERGSNTNGTYLKFGNGEMICYGYNTFVTPTSIATEGVYRHGTGDYRTNTFPATFYSNPSVNMMVHIGESWCALRTITTTNFTWRYYSYAAWTAGLTKEFYWTAHGRWKA